MLDISCLIYKKVPYKKVKILSFATLLSQLVYFIENKYTYINFILF